MIVRTKNSRYRVTERPGRPRFVIEKIEEIRPSGAVIVGQQFEVDTLLDVAVGKQMRWVDGQGEDWHSSPIEVIEIEPDLARNAASKENSG